MTNLELNNTLKEQALEMGACAKGMEGWEESDTDELLERYKDNIEFAIDNDWPSNMFISENFGRSQLASHGIYVNEKELYVKRQSGTLVFNGRCEGKVMCDRYCAVRMYVRHGSNLKIKVRQFASVFIDVYDDATIEIDCDNMSKAYVYAHNGTDKITKNGMVLVRDKRKKE